MKRVSWIGILLMLLLCAGFLALASCAVVDNFIRGAAEAAGLVVPAEGDPLTATDYLYLIGGLAGAALSGGWAGSKLSQKVGKVAKMARILSKGLYQAKKSATTEKISDITDAVGEAAESNGVKNLLDRLYEITKAEVDAEDSD